MAEKIDALFAIGVIVLLIGAMVLIDRPMAENSEYTITAKYYAVDSGKERFYMVAENDTIYEVDSRDYNDCTIGAKCEFKTLPDQEAEQRGFYWSWGLLFGGLICMLVWANDYTGRPVPEFSEVDVAALTERMKAFETFQARQMELALAKQKLGDKP